MGTDKCIQIIAELKHLLLTKMQRRNKQSLNVSHKIGRKLLSKARVQQEVEMNQEVVPLL